MIDKINRLSVEAEILAAIFREANQRIRDDLLLQGGNGAADNND